MKMSFVLGESEKNEVVIQRSWFTGSFTYSVNGQKHSLKSSLNPTTHFNITLKNTYQFEVGQIERHTVSVEHIRPLMFAGLRPQEFKVLVDGNLYKTYKGY